MGLVHSVPPEGFAWLSRVHRSREIWKPLLRIRDQSDAEPRAVRNHDPAILHLERGGGQLLDEGVPRHRHLEDRAIWRRRSQLETCRHDQAGEPDVRREDPVMGVGQDGDPTALGNAANHR